MSEVPQAIGWGEDGRCVHLLDQTLLPEHERKLEIRDADGMAEAITSLRVRGAPAIGIAGAMGMVLGMERLIEADPDADRATVLEEVSRLWTLLHDTRPTGRNLAWALDRVAHAVRTADEATAEALAGRARAEADAILQEDRQLCDRIGDAGLEVFAGGEPRVLTHCNAGALATGGIGTALAPIYKAHARGQRVQVLACETRPVLQGARLTAWELSRAGVPVTAITDSMAGDAMRRGRVDLVIVGADAVAANGDVVNKIGTYGLAVLANHHGIPFFVAMPYTTVDRSTSSGEEVPIELRSEGELRQLGGREILAADAAAWNPAFDVTPHRSVTAFITDQGVIRPPYGPRLAKLTEGHGPETGRFRGVGGAS
jgi:methylthioribose-1-phosphate isomerase